MFSSKNHLTEAQGTDLLKEQSQTSSKNSRSLIQKQLSELRKNIKRKNVLCDASPHPRKQTPQNKAE